MVFCDEFKFGVGVINASTVFLLEMCKDSFCEVILSLFLLDLGGQSHAAVCEVLSQRGSFIVCVAIINPGVGIWLLVEEEAFEEEELWFNLRCGGERRLLDDKTVEVVRCVRCCLRNGPSGYDLLCLADEIVVLCLDCQNLFLRGC